MCHKALVSLHGISINRDTKLQERIETEKSRSPSLKTKESPRCRDVVTILVENIDLKKADVFRKQKMKRH